MFTNLQLSGDNLIFIFWHNPYTVSTVILTALHFDFLSNCNGESVTLNGVYVMKSDSVCVSEKIAALSDEQVNVLMDIICVGEEFALLRETLRLYADELVDGEKIH